MEKFFIQKNNYTYEDLINCANGKLFGPEACRLPAPPMLMFDRITRVSQDSTDPNIGYIEAEFDIKPDLWFFDCHFKDDPVMPGCLGLDALWQLVGFYLGWLGFKGMGRALGVDSVKFRGMILPTNKKVTYKINIDRLIQKKIILGQANGSVWVDGQEIYMAEGLKVSLSLPAAKS